MKKILAIFVMVLFVAYPAVSEANKGGSTPLEVSGLIVLQHVMVRGQLFGRDYVAGGDNTDAYKVYLSFDKQITSDIKAHVTINVDQFGSQGGGYLIVNTPVTHYDNILGEAYLLFTGVAERDISLIFGKMEAPFGQDYNQFITPTHTHLLEVDKVWGAGVVFGLADFGSISAAVVMPANMEGYDIRLTDTKVLKIKADKLIDGLSLEASRIVFADPYQNAFTDNKVQTSLAGKYTIGDFTIALEQTKVDNPGYRRNRDTESTLLWGADYRIGKVLLKTNYETIDNTALPLWKKTVTMYGANYELANGVYTTIEASTIENVDRYPGDNVSQILLGLCAHF